MSLLLFFGSTASGAPPVPLSALLTTLANVKDDLGITDTNDDAYLSRQISAASSALAAFCGRVFGYHSETEVVRLGTRGYFGRVAPYGTPLDLDIKPLVCKVPYIISLTVNENSDPLLTAGEDYDLDARAGLVYRVRNGLRAWWTGPIVTLQYTTGWQLPGDDPVPGVPALPAIVEECAISLVRAAYLRRGRDPNIILDVAQGVGRTGYAPGRSATAILVDSDMAAALQPYRVMDV